MPDLCHKFALSAAVDPGSVSIRPEVPRSAITHRYLRAIQPRWRSGGAERSCIISTCAACGCPEDSHLKWIRRAVPRHLQDSMKETARTDEAQPQTPPLPKYIIVPLTWPARSLWGLGIVIMLFAGIHFVVEFAPTI